MDGDGEEEFFDLDTINEYELQYNKGGSVIIQDNCVVIKHNLTKKVKLLPLQNEVLQALGLAVVYNEEDPSQQAVDGGAEMSSQETEMLLQETGMPLQESEMLLQETEMPLQETVMPLQESKMPLQETKMSLQETEMPLQESGMAFQETKMPLQETEMPLQESGMPFQEAEMVSQEAEMVKMEKMEPNDDYQEGETTTNNAVDIIGDDGQITIVYTDDEDAELNEVAQTMSGKSKQKQMDSEGIAVLHWSRPKTFRLLDLYEKLHERFYRDKYRHRVLWSYILIQLQGEFPILTGYSEAHIQSKFLGMKRTYKGLENYMKGDLNTTSWPYYERMKKIMEKDRELRESGHKMFQNESFPWEARGETELDSSQSKKGVNATRLWKRQWIPLLLDVYEENISEAHKLNFWHTVTEKMALAEPDCSHLTPLQARQKYFNLKKALRQNRDLPKGQIKGKLRNATIYKRLETLQALEENVGVNAPLNDESLDSGEEDLTNSQWPRGYRCTSMFLDLLIKSRDVMEGGRKPDYTAVCAALRRELGAGAEHVTPAACAQRADALKRKFQKLRLQYPEDRWNEISWPYFQKCLRAFELHSIEWSASATSLLMELYARTAAALDESGPKFWSELARAFREKKGGAMTPRRCEMKMQSLFLKYKLMLRKHPHTTGQASGWRPFQKMHSIFGSRAAPWTSRGADQLLLSYRAHLPRLLRASTEQEAMRVWQSVSEEINEAAPQSSPVDAGACRDKMVEYKTKYCKLMRDEEAARAWPQYKKMSELFSSHLWSKDNVNLLLDIYEPMKSSIEDAEDATALWTHVASKFNARSPTSAVIGPQCQTEIQVLCARYRALAGPAARAWPFYERVHRICSQFQPTKRAIKREPFDGPEDGETAVYSWTDETVSRLLDAYERHRDPLTDSTRSQVWEVIDQELTSADPTYTPGKQGYGGWRKYLHLMTMYKHRRDTNTGQDWPFYERMERIQENRSDAESDTENLEHLLTANIIRRNPGKRCLVIETRATTPNSANKRRKVSWSPSEEELLVAECARCATVFNEGDGDYWQRLHKQIKRRSPAFSKSPSECENKMASRYWRMRRNGTKLAYHLRLPDSVYKKLHSIFANYTSSELENGDGDVGDSDVLNMLLAEIRRRNELHRERQRMIEKQMELSKTQHAEKMKVLNQILDTVRALPGRKHYSGVTQALTNDVIAVQALPSDVIDQLERNMEEIHRSEVD